MKTRYYIGVSLLCLLGLFHACVQDPTTEQQPDNSNEFLNIATAKEYVEWQMVQKTKAHAIKTKGLIPGNFTLLWDKARKSQNENVERFDIPIIPEYTYYALRGEEVNGKMKARKVRIAQKIVVIKSKNSGKLASYILTLIPDGDYYSKNKNNFEESFSLNRHHFSGVAIYYDFFARFNVRLDRYVDGQKRAGLYLVCKKEEWDKRAAIAKKILGPIQVIRRSNTNPKIADHFNNTNILFSHN